MAPAGRRSGSGANRAKAADGRTQNVRVETTRESAASRYQRIYKAVRERISLLQYPPGTVLSEAAIAAEFGVSRTPVRRVFQRLDFEGLVTIKNGVGTIVTDIDLKTFKELYDLRMRLIELIGELSPRMPSAETIQRVEALLERAHRLKASRDVEEYARICNELGECILELIGSAPLREITEMFYYRAARTWLTFLPNVDWPEVAEALEAEVREILDAMRSGDITSVGHIRRQHFYQLLMRVSEFISRH